MNVLLVGSGGREHALAWALRKSPRLGALYAAPGSDAILELAERCGADPSDFAALASFCKTREVGLVVVGPEAPLAAGLADALRGAGIPVFGPGREAARLESSKAWAKAFMARHGVPTARYEAASDLASARKALARFEGGVVVKADGLAAGKGVRVCASKEEAEAALEAFMEDGVLGDSGRRVVLEERLEGPEVTLMGLCDATTFLALPPSADHKRLLDGDRGPNTGGMGVFAPTPTATSEVLARVRKEIVEPTLRGLKEDGLDYRGLLYVGLMLTPKGPKVIEYNSRFGDPETQAVLPLLEGDLLDLLEAAAAGSLADRQLSWRGASVCVVLASEGYPNKAVTGREISGLGEVPKDVLVFHAGTKKDGRTWRTAGGRVLGVSAVAPSLAQAREKAYAAADRVRFEGMQRRSDIARALAGVR